MVTTRQTDRSSKRTRIDKKKVTLGPSKKPVYTILPLIPKETGISANSDAPSGSVTELVNPRGGKIILKGPSRPPGPEDVQAVRGNDDGQSEQTPDQPTTVIGRKMRKKRIRETAADEGKPSEADLIKTKSASDLYSCKIDSISEAQVVDAIQRINYSIASLISNIMDGVKSKRSKLSYPKSLHQKNIQVPTKPDLDITLESLLLESQLSYNTRDLVVEALLHNLISCLLHKHFFKGGHFFGVGSEALRGYLETMFSKLVASGNSDLTAIQRWRSMSVEAVFQMNGGVESQLNDELITELGRMLKIAFPLSPNHVRPKQSKPELNCCESTVRGEKQLLLDIIHQARKLSFMIQHEIISCQLLVTIAPVQTSSDTASGDETIANYKEFDKELVCNAWTDMRPRDGDKVLGTYAFGLQRISGPERHILIQPKVTTSALLRSDLVE